MPRIHTPSDNLLPSWSSDLNSSATISCDRYSCFRSPKLIKCIPRVITNVSKMARAESVLLVFFAAVSIVASAEIKKETQSTNESELIELNPENIEELYNLTENVIPNSKHSEEDLATWEAPLAIRQEFPYYLSGYDEDGRPIWVTELGRWNLRKVVEEGGQKFKDFDKYVRQAAIVTVQSLELKSTPEYPVTDAVLIADFADLNIIQIAHLPTLTYILRLAREFQYLIERHIYVGLVLNANFVAERLMNLLRPIFGPIMEKLEIYGNNKARFVPHVLKYCPRDQIPEWYGGAKGFQPLRVYG